MKKAFITGANKSIGFEVAKQLLQHGFYVYLGTRSLEKGQQAVEQLKAEGLTNVEAIQIDVTDDNSVKNARLEMGKKTEVLDILINNAGISGAKMDTNGKSIPQTALTTGVDVYIEVYETNVYGVVRVTQAFIDLMNKSEQPRIVNVTSGLGSQTIASDPTNKYYHFKFPAYQSSKSALNMYTINLAYELLNTSFKVNVVDPGFTKTDFNSHRGTGTVEDAAKRIVKYALIDKDGATGNFFSEEFNPETGEIPW